ncbi:MAG: OmpA family protein [Pseudomonadota bacterium]
MLRKRRSEGPGLNREAWMTTFMDLMTLLLTFFVLLFSWVSLDAGKIKGLQDSLRDVMGVLEMGTHSEYNIGVPIITADSVDVDKQLENRIAKVQEDLKSLSDEKDVKVKVTKRGVTITLADNVLFDLGVAEISPRAHPPLNKVMAIIKKDRSFNIRVEGHTDNLPIKTERFPSNWELSIARAVNVVKYFLRDGEIVPKRFSAAGYGEAKPLLPNYTPEYRAKNRRVEILLLTEEKG